MIQVFSGIDNGDEETIDLQTPSTEYKLAKKQFRMAVQHNGNTWNWN